jgi:hypothetical protein
MKPNSQSIKCWKMILKKNQLKKKTRVNQVNSSNPWLESWNWDKSIKNKLKQIMKLKSLANQILKVEIEKKNID